MRLPTLAICTLAALMAGTVNAKASPIESNSTSHRAIALEETQTAQQSNQLSAQLKETSEAEVIHKTNFVSQASSTDATGLQELQANREPAIDPASCFAQASSPGSQVAQAPVNCPRPEPIPPLRIPQVSGEFESSPGLSIYIPVGFGADRNTLFVSGTYQTSTREHNDDDNNGAFGVGLGLGNADKAFGLELSYVFDDFNQDFPDGGLNAKLHRRFGDVGIAVGYNGFINLGRNDYEHSRYGVITGIIRTRPSVRQPLSRIALTVGVGDGQFRSNGAIDAKENNANIFGNVAIRVVQPVSAIVEWTGVDLAAGLSIAPVRNVPWVITPAVRDILGAGDEPRFVLGTGISIKF